MEYQIPDQKTIFIHCHYFNSACVLGFNSITFDIKYIYDEFYLPTRTDQAVSYKELHYIFEYLAVEMETAYKSNCMMNFTKYIKRYIQAWYSQDQEITNFQKRKILYDILYPTQVYTYTMPPKDVHIKFLLYNWYILAW